MQKERRKDQMVDKQQNIETHKHMKCVTNKTIN